MRKDYSYPAFILLVITCILLAKPWQITIYPPQYKIETFKCLKQPDHITCGPTSGAMLLNHYNIPVTIKEVEKETKTHWLTFKNTEIGMSAPDYLAQAIKKMGLSVKLEVGDIDKLRYYISDKRPPIVLLRSGQQYWHYVVVVGYDEQFFYLADPGYGEINKISIETFSRAWDFYGDMSGAKFGIDLYYLAIRGSDITGNMLIVPQVQAP